MLTNQLRRIRRGDLRSPRRDRIDRLIRGRRVARTVNQSVSEMKNTNRDLRPPIRVPRIRRCGGGCAKRNRRRGFEDSAVGYRASRACVGPSIIACARFADARSRPPAARSAGGAKRSALTARTRTAPWSATAPRCRDAHPRSHDARPLPAWRERPRPWPRARSQTRSDLVVAHATFLRLSASSPTVRPRAAKSAARSLSSTTPTRYFSYGAVWRVNATKSSRVGQTKHGTSRGNTSRGGAFPPWFP